MAEKTLSEIRQELDEIDDALHDLIMRRAGVAAHVAAAKKAKGLPIRPSREAAMLRRLSGRHESNFPITSLARMWHEMIAAFTMIQADYRITVFADEAHVSIWDMARDQYGSQTRIGSVGTRREALMQVMSGEADLAVLPPPEEDESETWWTSLAVPGAPVIMQSLPFAGVGNLRGPKMRAVGVAAIELEPTGDDLSLIVVRTADRQSRSALKKTLMTVGLDVQLLATAEENGEHLFLGQVESFLTQDDSRISEFASVEEGAVIRVIGCYARPLDPS